MKTICLSLVLVLTMINTAEARIHRNPAAVRAFKHMHPCPINGSTKRCPGYVVDHVIALCRGGEDAPSNMQWQTIAEGKAKDRWECKRKL
jgi:hypothetical protein